MSKNHSEEYLKKQLEEAEKANSIYQHTLKALKTEERYVNFFNTYNASSVESFMKYYASLKANWYQNADSSNKFLQHKKNKWRNGCLAHLRNLFNKKLFNAKCRWVAGEIDLEGIETSDDFYYLSHYPEKCTFLEPITYEEFNCLLEFMEVDKLKNDEEREEEDNRNAFPNIAIEFYHLHKALYVESAEDMIPDWFHFYDKRFHTQGLLTLPLRRIEMEIDWLDIWNSDIYFHTLTELQQKKFHHRSRMFRKEMHENPEKDKQYREEQNKKWEEEMQSKPKQEHYLLYGEFLEKAVNALEDSQIKKMFRAYTTWHKRRSGNENIEMNLIDLSDVKEWVSIESHDDYREAIKKAFADFSEKKIIQTLPLIFEEYRACIDSNKLFDWNSEEDNAYYTTNNERKKHILQARKLKGQAENFDFLKKDNLPKS